MARTDGSSLRCGFECIAIVVDDHGEQVRCYMARTNSMIVMARTAQISASSAY